MQFLSHSPTYSRSEAAAVGELNGAFPQTDFARFSPDESIAPKDTCNFGCSDVTTKIERCIAYMESNLNKPLRVSTLSALLGVSPSHFFFLFKRITGRSPIDFFIRMRVRRACEFLERTTLSVKEIAVSLGYEDQFYFSRVFKSVIGLAPRNYRLRLLQDQTRTLAKSEDPRSDRFSFAPIASFKQLPGGGVHAGHLFAKTRQASAA